MTYNGVLPLPCQRRQEEQSEEGQHDLPFIAAKVVQCLQDDLSEGNVCFCRNGPNGYSVCTRKVELIYLQNSGKAGGAGKASRNDAIIPRGR